MDKKIKLWVGIALVGVAAYLILKPKAPKTNASTDPKCKDNEHLEDLVSPCLPNTPCPQSVKVCVPNSTSFSKVKCNDGTEDVAMSDSPCIDNGGIFIHSKQNDDVQAEGFNGY